MWLFKAFGFDRPFAYKTKDTLKILKTNLTKNLITMAEIKLTGNKKVGTFCRDFQATFGCVIRVYDGKSLADDSATLASIRKEGAKGGELTISGQMKVGNLEKKIMDMYGIRVQIATADNSALADDSLTIASVKNTALVKETSKAEPMQKSKKEVVETNNELDALRKELEAANKAKAEAEAAKAEAEKARLKAETDKKKAEAAKVIENKLKKSSKIVNGALPGVFTVSSRKKVRFSQGNLQFHPKKYEFRFAEYQWDCIGKANENISPNYDGWIDLFGWATSGYKGCQPTEVSTTPTEYGPAFGSLTGSKANYDWGVYNPITNGGNRAGVWRLLKDSEWEFLIEKRKNADKLRAPACVNGVNGLVILPDNFYELGVRVSFDCTLNGYASNKYDGDVWTMLEDKGALFIPAAGSRDRNGVIDVCSHRLWSASCSYSGRAYCLSIYSYGVSVLDTYRYYGYAVRLAKDIY